jgi:hypothetical protein
MRFLKVLILIISLLLSNSSFSQEKGSCRLSVTNEITSYNPGYLTSYGITFQYFVNKYFSLNYHYSFGYNQKNKFYSHYNGSLIAFAELIKTSNYYNISSDNDGLIYLLFISLFIPEGISFHTYPRKWLEISTFINPLGADYNIFNDKKTALTLSLGVKTIFKPTNRVSFSPHFGTKYIYSKSDISYIYGVSIGYTF